MPKPPLTHQPKRDAYRLPDGPLTPPELLLYYIASAVGAVCVVAVVIARSM